MRMESQRKNAYRKFKIKWFKGQDDYPVHGGSAYPVGLPMDLRNSRSLKKKACLRQWGAFPAFPDLLMMDGGKGQVNVALRVLDSLHLDIPVCGMVKDDHHNTRGVVL